MYIQNEYENFAQRMAAFYCTALADFPQNLQVEEIDSYRLLHNFFKNFYETLYNGPESLGIPVIPDAFLKLREHKSRNIEFKKALDGVRAVVADFINFLYQAGQLGTVEGKDLVTDISCYKKFLSKKKAPKEKLLACMAEKGFCVTVQDTKAALTHEKYPEMMTALRQLAIRCSQNKHKIGRFCFFLCDFGALQTDYQPEPEVLLGKVLPFKEEYQYLMDIHKFLAEKGYNITVKFEGDMSWEISYTNKKVKSSPLFSIAFEVAYENPVIAKMRFVSTSRIVPLMGEASEEIQRNFYNISGECRGSSCGWCRNQKGLLHPSLLKVDQQKKTICWYLQRDYDHIDAEVFNTILEYINLHEKLQSKPRKNALAKKEAWKYEYS